MIDSYLNPDNLRNKHVEINPPYFVINDLNNCVPIVVSSLEDGEIPLVGTHKGVTKVVKYISPSAFNVDWLTRVTTLTYVGKDNTSVNITTPREYLEVMCNGSYS